MPGSEERRLDGGLYSTFSKPAELVVDPFSGAFANAKGCLKLPQHHCFMDFDVDVDCFAASTEAPVQTYARQVLDEEVDISGTGELVGACKIVIRTLDKLQARMQMRLWKVPAEICPVQIFLSHIMHLLSNMLADPFF